MGNAAIHSDDTMKPRLVLDRERCDSLKRHFAILETRDDGWTTHYRDADGDEWIETRLYPESHGGGTSYLVRLPLPSLTELVEIALTSPLPDEAELGARLLAGDPVGRRDLFRRLQSEAARASESDSIRIRAIISWGNLESGMNPRPTLWNDASEIRTDVEI